MHILLIETTLSSKCEFLYLNEYEQELIVDLILGYLEGE